MLEKTMTVLDPTARTQLLMEEISSRSTAPTVSWSAIVAGAFAAAALSFVLLSIGAAFGLSLASPWDLTQRDAAESAAAAGIGAAIFLVVIHAISSGVGGYLAGRLRPKPTGLRGDETYFRDTAHGLVVWAVGAVAIILIIASLAAAAARGTVDLAAAGLNAAGQDAEGAAPAAMDQMRGDGDHNAYLVDTLFRPTGSAAAPAPASGQPAQQAAPAPGAATLPVDSADRPGQRAEAGRIMRMALDGELSPEDKTYLAQLIAQDTGMSQQEAEQRVNQTIDKAKTTKAEAEQKAKEAADAVRKAGMYTALLGAVAMLVGAFSAALAAAWGGRARDA
jgi:hypothetical protein